ncbi:MAG TPA: cytochrome bd-I oxidase subunit CydX [Rhizomicrobium sp.]|nr:cytochrome bd-I oxidase subunit CydX [Rhizomicrobium sp.]
MWYFSWVLGLGFAVTLAVLNAMWLEHRSAKDASGRDSSGEDRD